MVKNIRRASMYTIIGKLLSKLLGLIRERLTKTLFGLSSEMSIFSFVITLIGLLRSISIRSFTKTAVPYYLANKEDRTTVSSIYTMVILFNILLGIIIIIFNKRLAYSTLGNLINNSSHARFAQYMYIMAGVLLIILSISDLSEALLSGMRIFIYQIIREPLINSIYILFLLLFPNTYMLIGGRVIGELIFGILIVIFIIYKHPIRFSRPKLAHIKTIWLVTMPVILGTSINFINTFIDRYMATLLTDTRSVSALASATTLAILPYALFGEAIAKSVYTGISEAAVVKNFEQFAEYIAKVLYLGGWIIIPASVGLGVLSPNITYFLYFGGKFTMADVSLVANALFFYSFRYLFTALYIPLNNALIALEKGNISMWLTVIFVPLNILLNWLLGFKFNMGAPGFALATAIISFLMFMSLIIIIFTIIKTPIPYYYLYAILKIIVANIIMGFTLILIKIWVPITRIYTIILIMIGTLVYITALIIIKDEEIWKIIEKLQRGNTK